MSEILNKAVDMCNKYSVSFCKFISANDAGTTGAHQQGFYIPKSSYSLLFDSPGEKNMNKDKYVAIKWQDDFETQSRFIWYGKGTRSEYRITRFGREFPFFTDEHVGSLLILLKIDEDEYQGFVLDSDEDIDAFLSTYGLSSIDTNNLIRKTENLIPTLEKLISDYIHSLSVGFPDTLEVSRVAREITGRINGTDIIANPDRKILEWIDTEYIVFKAIESDRYQERISTPFNSVEELVECANTLLNRRKSRAGKSLEHHLESMFSYYSLPFAKQARTEGNKRPDFIFPGEEAYHDMSYASNKLMFLGAKTTCKDRWRQVLNEADRIEVKHLFTLQQGISENQLGEMYDYKVSLVIPKAFIDSFPQSFREKIIPLEGFINVVRERCLTRL